MESVGEASGLQVQQRDVLQGFSSAQQRQGDQEGRRFLAFLTHSSAFALVSPAVLTRSRIRIKVVRGGYSVGLGLAHKQQMEQSGYQWPKNENDRGVYLIQGNMGWVCNVLDP